MVYFLTVEAVIEPSYPRRIRSTASFVGEVWKMNPKGEKTWGALRSTQAELTFLHENWAGSCFWSS